MATGESWEAGVGAIRWRWRGAIRECSSIMTDGGGPDRAVASGER